jgi:hypothetical protein
MAISLSLSLSTPPAIAFLNAWKDQKLQTLKSFKKQLGQNRGEEGTGRVLRIVLVP